MHSGLTTKQVEERIQQNQINGRSENASRTNKTIICSNIFTYFNFVNLILFVFVLLTGKMKNGLFIGTVIFNTSVGIYQQLKSKKLLDQLSILAETKVKVKRDGKWIEILPEDIVVDDLISLSVGMQVPVDGIVLNGQAEIDESTLTGEAKPIEKKENNVVYAGTMIVSGTMKIQVTKVGETCTIRQIMSDASKEMHVSSNLRNDLDKIIRSISYLIIPVGILLFLTQYYFIHLNWDNALLKTIAAIVGMIPEGLIVLTSIALAVSSIRLSKKSVLVQDLFSIESLARVDMVCFDKTGTLTTGNMQVNQVVCFNGMNEEKFIPLMQSYLNDEVAPNATSNALIKYFSKGNHYSVQESLPFSSSRKYASKTLNDYGTIYVGAYTFLFREYDENVLQQINTYTKEGKRVLAVCSSKQPIQKDVLPYDLKLIALIVIQDELRTNAKEIVDYFKKQDVKVCILSGDDALTVSSLAKQIGIDHADEYVDYSSCDEPIDVMVKKYRIFGRVTPEGKKKLVQAFQKDGHHILMNGDGVNDVPSMKIADVSVSIGCANDAAKNNANIILLNNDFSEIPSIVDEGRRVINNISRASSMYFVKTTFSILLAVYVILCRQSYPFIPIHLTLISAIGVGIPTFFLQMEPSFERIHDKFVLHSYMNSLPSSICVFITAFVCATLKQNYGLDDTRFSGLFVLLTGIVYIITLFKVYHPLTKNRFCVISCMTILLFLALFCLQNVFSVSFHWNDLWIFILCIILEGTIIYLLTKLIDKLTNR